jgi:hypothetical protein
MRLKMALALKMKLKMLMLMWEEGQEDHDVHSIVYCTKGSDRKWDEGF